MGGALLLQERFGSKGKKIWWESRESRRRPSVYCSGVS